MWKCYKDDAVASYLVLLRLDSNSYDANGNTPFLEIWQVSHAILFIEHGADVNARNNRGKSVLHTAAGMWNTEWINYLVF